MAGSTSFWSKLARALTGRATQEIQLPAAPERAVPSFSDRLLEHAMSLDSMAGDGMPRGLITDLQSIKPRVGRSGERVGILSWKSMLDMYDRNDLVRSVVDTKRRQIASLDWGVAPMEEGVSLLAPLCKSIRDLFANPGGEGMDYTQFMLAMLKDLYVLDAAAVELVRNAWGDIVERIPRDGSTIRPIMDEHGCLEGYKQVVQQGGISREVEFCPDDMMYISANPSTQRVYGHSPLETLAIIVGADLYAVNYNASNFTDGHLHDKILFFGNVGNQFIKDFRTWFQKKRGKANELPAFTGITDPQTQIREVNLRTTPKDMEWQAMQHWFFQRICACYQVSPDQIIMLQAMQTKATGEAQRNVQAEKGSAPEIAIIETAFTTKIVHQFSEHCKFAFTEANKTDELEEAQIWSAQFVAGRPLNELRTEAGLKPILTPTIDVQGEVTPLYDLPLNPQTGEPLGYAVWGDAAMLSPFGDLSGGAEPTSNPLADMTGRGGSPFPSSNPLSAMTGSAGGGGSTGWPFKTLKARNGRRQPIDPDPSQRALHHWEARRASLAGGVEAAVPGHAKACSCGAGGTGNPMAGQDGGEGQ